MSDLLLCIYRGASDIHSVSEASQKLSSGHVLPHGPLCLSVSRPGHTQEPLTIHQLALQLIYVLIYTTRPSISIEHRPVLYLYPDFVPYHSPHFTQVW